MTDTAAIITAPTARFKAAKDKASKRQREFTNPPKSSTAPIASRT